MKREFVLVDSFEIKICKLFAKPTTFVNACPQRNNNHEAFSNTNATLLDPSESRRVLWRLQASLAFAAATLGSHGLHVLGELRFAADAHAAGLETLVDGRLLNVRMLAFGHAAMFARVLGECAGALDGMLNPFDVNSVLLAASHLFGLLLLNFFTATQINKTIRNRLLTRTFLKRSS